MAAIDIHNNVDHLSSSKCQVKIDHQFTTNNLTSLSPSQCYILDEDNSDHMANEKPVDLLIKISNFINTIKLNTVKYEKLHTEVVNECDTLESNLRSIASFASEYDYKDIPANGYRTMLRLFGRMLEITCGLTNKKHRIEDFVSVIKNFNPIIVAIISLRQQQTQGILDMQAHRNLLIEMFTKSYDIMKITLNSKYLSMNIPNYKWMLKLVLKVAAVLAPNASPRKRFKGGISDKNASLYLDTISNTKLTRLATYLRLLDQPFSRSFGSLLRSTVRPVDCKVKRHTKKPIPSFYHINVSSNGTQLVKRAYSIMNNVNFSVLRNTTPHPQHPDDIINNEGKVMLYLHGGAFVGPTAHSLENLYIKDFASASRNLTLINIDYPLCPEHRFPVAIELLIDFYLWLTNYPDEVTKILGFQPHTFILSGDSAGANLAAALLIVLNDINRNEQLQLSNLKIIMPSSMVLFMPKMSINFQFVPSYICTLFDPILSAILLLRAGEMYMPIRKKDKLTGKWKLITRRTRISSNSNDINNSSGNDENDENDDLHVIPEEIPKDYIIRDDYEFVPSVYHSPLDYSYLNELCNVKLSVVSTTFDPLMDESIEIVRRWPGQSSLSIVDPCYHGIYGASLLMSKATSNLMESCYTSIRDACSVNTQVKK